MIEGRRANSLGYAMAAFCADDPLLRAVSVVNCAALFTNHDNKYPAYLAY